MSPHLIIAAVIAAMGFGAAWQIQSWRYTSKEADREQQQLEQVQQSAAASIRRADNVIAAQNAANARSVVLDRDRDRAYLELERLRTAASQVPGASATPDACPDRADTARELLVACGAELIEMGAKADRHASDAMMLQQAWPK